MKISIFDWNTALTEKNVLSDDITTIIEFIYHYLEKDNSLAVLQQIPFKILSEPRERIWRISPIYNRIIKVFSENEYKFFCNNFYNNGKVMMMTIVITKMKEFKPADKLFYPNAKITNREVAIEIQYKQNKENFVILGVHAKNGVQNKSYLKSINGNADIILGDFNAGDYLESENREIFNSILNEHVCICNMPTKEIKNIKGELIRKSCIDHIFIKRKFISKCSNFEIFENVKCSDHYPISFEINLDSFF